MEIAWIIAFGGTFLVGYWRWRVAWPKAKGGLDQAITALGILCASLLGFLAFALLGELVVGFL